MQDVGHGEGLGHFAGLQAGAGIDQRVAAFGADVFEVVARQIAFAAQVVEEDLLVAGLELGVERALAHLLGQHLGGVAAHVGGDPDLADRLAGQGT